MFGLLSPTFLSCLFPLVWWCGRRWRGEGEGGKMGHFFISWTSLGVIGVKRLHLLSCKVGVGVRFLWVGGEGQIGKEGERKRKKKWTGPLDFKSLHLIVLKDSPRWTTSYGFPPPIVQLGDAKDLKQPRTRELEILWFLVDLSFFIPWCNLHKSWEKKKTYNYMIWYIKHHNNLSYLLTPIGFLLCQK